jgi:hypothetical protein
LNRVFCCLVIANGKAAIDRGISGSCAFPAPNVSDQRLSEFGLGNRGLVHGHGVGLLERLGAIPEPYSGSAHFHEIVLYAEQGFAGGLGDS